MHVNYTDMEMRRMRDAGSLPPAAAWLVYCEGEPGVRAELRREFGWCEWHTPVWKPLDFRAVAPTLVDRSADQQTKSVDEIADLHPRTRDLVDRFARALTEKLAAAEKKYGYRDGWADPDWLDECREQLVEHVNKGDPRDVAAYCAFLWHHGASTEDPDGRLDSEPEQPTVAECIAQLDTWNGRLEAAIDRQAHQQLGQHANDEPAAGGRDPMEQFP